MREGFPVSEDLPKTFSDAILVAHKLGIPYLWIDSLCIVQGDESDWAVESSRMASVYNNSYLTIAAANSDSDDKGFLRPRPFEYSTVRLTSARGESAFVYLGRKEYDLPDYGKDLGDPLFDRAWVLQEQYLSKRTLVFSEKQIYFVCHQLVIQDHRPFSESNLLNGLDINSAFRRVVSDWRRVPCELSKRQLTYDTDKLPSIAGIASTVSTTSDGAQRNYCAGLWMDGAQRKYCAGLWMDELPNDLLFYRLGKTAALQEYAAPSWSWAALNGSVSWISDNLDRWTWEELARIFPGQIENCEIMLRDTRNPYGRVDAGCSLTICSHIVELNHCSASVESKIPRWQELTAEPSSPYNLVKQEPCSCHISQRIAWCILDLPDTRPNRITGIILASRHRRRRVDDSTGLVGILVVPRESENGQDGYTRVGVFDISTPDGTADSEQILKDFPPQRVVLY